MTSLPKVMLTAGVLMALAAACVSQEVPGLAYMEILKTVPRGDGSMTPLEVKADEASVRYDVMLDYDFYPFEEGSQGEHPEEDLPEGKESLVSTALERPPSIGTTPVISSERRENASFVTTRGSLEGPVDPSKKVEFHPSDTQSQTRKEEEEEGLRSVTLRSRSSHETAEGAASQTTEESVQFVKTVRASPHSNEAGREEHSSKGSAEIPLMRSRQTSLQYIYPRSYLLSDYLSYMYSPTGGKYATGQYPASAYLHSGNPERYHPVDEYPPSYYPAASYSNGYSAPSYPLRGYPTGYYPTGSYPSYSIPRAGYINQYDTADTGSGYNYPGENDSSRRYISGLTGDNIPYEDSIERPLSRESYAQNESFWENQNAVINVKLNVSEEVQSPTSSRRQPSYASNSYVVRDKNSRTPRRQTGYKVKLENTPRNQPEATVRAPLKLPAGVKKDVAAVRYYTGLQREIERSDLLSDAIKDVRTRDGKSVKSFRWSTTTTTVTPVPDMGKIKRSFGTHPLYSSLPRSSSPEIGVGPIIHKEKYDDEEDEYDNLYLPVRAKSLELEEIREVKKHFNILVPKAAYKPTPFSETPPYPGQGIYIPPVTTFKPYEIPKYNKKLKPSSVPGEGYDSGSQLEFPVRKDSSYRYQRPSTYSDSLKYYRPHDSSVYRTVTPEPYYHPTYKPYVLSTPRPYHPLTSRPKVQPIDDPYVPPIPKFHNPLTSRPHVSPTPKSWLPPTKYISPSPKVVLTSRPKITVTARPKVILSSRPKITLTSKPKPKAAAIPRPYPRPSLTPYPRLSSTSKPRAIRFPKSLDPPGSQSPVEDHSKSPPSFTSRDKAPHSRGHARVPSSILREQGQGSPVKEKFREKRRPDMETQIDSSIKFPKYGYNIDHYFEDFPAFGYFNLNRKSR
ncbi:adhesive plaque matrix protein-like [Penaeus monodon]|uniref:adhesive plaque matrix protein-like n=1 Tax=Penaeus monodon TaxID=6687 RepID=UPI0018A721D4|nr:adhesive plaque matrix protein-like [Penaeus monodon]